MSKALHMSRLMTSVVLPLSNMAESSLAATSANSIRAMRYMPLGPRDLSTFILALENSEFMHK